MASSFNVSSAGGYEQLMGRWSKRLAPLFVGFSGLSDGERVLDVGCGAGSHSLYLQNQNFDVTSIDISPNAIKACQLRGLKNARIADLLLFNKEKFDTILLLMNGTGIFGTLENTPKYLQHLITLLRPNGQILIDSSDIIYMFDEDDYGGRRIESDGYYGKLEFQLSYKGEDETPFP